MMSDPTADIGLTDWKAAEVGVNNVFTTQRVLGKDSKAESVPEDTSNCTFREADFLCDLVVSS